MKYSFYNQAQRASTTMMVKCSDGRVALPTGVPKQTGELNSQTGYVMTTDAHIETNYKLMEFRIKIRSQYASLFAEIGAPPTKIEFKELVTGKLSKKRERHTLHDVLVMYKKECETKEIISDGKPLRESTKKNKISQINTIIKVCDDDTLSFNLTKRYYTRSNGTAQYESIGEDIIASLLANDYDSSSIFTTINNLKSILRWYLKRNSPTNLELVSSISFQNIKYPVEVLSSEDTEYLISQNQQLRMKLSPRQRDVMDYLISSLFLAPRVGDMKLWNSSNLYEKNGGSWLGYVQQKTGTRIDVPINDIVNKIFLKNITLHRSLLPSIKGDINIPLRQILSLVPSLQEQGSRTRIVGGKITEIRRPRWQMISIHKMRATAITNMLDAGVPEHIVKSFSGHTGDSKAFSKYIKARGESKVRASETYLKSIAI